MLKGNFSIAVIFATFVKGSGPMPLETVKIRPLFSKI